MGGLLIMNILLAVARTPHMEVESDLNYKRHFSKSFEISQRFSNQSDQNSARLSERFSDHFSWRKSHSVIG